MIATLFGLLGVASAGQIAALDAASQATVDRAARKARAHQEPARSRLHVLAGQPWIDAGSAPYVPDGVPCETALAGLWERGRAAAPAADGGPLAGVHVVSPAPAGMVTIEETQRWSRLLRSAERREIAWWAEERGEGSFAQLHGAPTDLSAWHVVRDALVRYDARGAPDLAYVELWGASDESFCAAWACPRPEIPEDGVVVRTLVARDPTAAAAAAEAARIHGRPSDAWGWRTTVVEHRTPGGGRRYLAAWQEPVALAFVCDLLRPVDRSRNDHDWTLWHWNIAPGDDWTLRHRTSLPLSEPDR